MGRRRDGSIRDCQRDRERVHPDRLACNGVDLKEVSLSRGGAALKPRPASRDLRVLVIDSPQSGEADWGVRQAGSRCGKRCSLQPPTDPCRRQAWVGFQKRAAGTLHGGSIPRLRGARCSSIAGNLLLGGGVPVGAVEEIGEGKNKGIKLKCRKEKPAEAAL